MEDKILRIGKSGVEAIEAKYQKLVENIAGARIPGYRAADVVIRAFPTYLEAAQGRTYNAGEVAGVDGSYFENSPGMLQSTGISTDVAIEGDGFFVIQGSWGQGYTRDGRFSVDSEGRLLTVAGNYPVIGEGGPIVLVPGTQFTVDQIGQIIVNGDVVDKIRVVKFSSNQGLQFVTGSILRGGSNPEVLDTPRVLQGYVETSNANVVDQMANMIQLSRIQSLDTKMISARDQMLSKMIEMGRSQ
ncbi:MAG: flagellar hook-basal body complex protein [bacterium]